MLTYLQVPIPSYLLAIVTGKLVSRDIGPRSRVWCEQPMIEQAAWEFDEVNYCQKNVLQL